MKKIVTILVLCLIICGCSKASKDDSIETIMKENKHIIIDVRTKGEYEESHIKGSINIPYDELDDSLDKNKIIFVYCKSGGRSKIVYDTLINLGYTVYDLGAFSEIELPKE